MSKPIIEVRNISKEYQYKEKLSYYSLRDSISGIFKNKNRSQSKEKFWALKDISFNVMPGEIIGIIGRNGAGKSTLLKILSQITLPTKGQIKLRGRVSSLLEVGTGFHPELTGKENIYLNGAILGMSQKEVQNKFDEIVDFAEIEKFLDTTVKHYSSGMYMRLAFAIAAHLEPDILLVDEVLAVGDIEFQKKCLGKMAETSREGRTILFVSHNIPAIQTLCKKTLLLEKGGVKTMGKTQQIIDEYFSNVFSSEVQPQRDLEGLCVKKITFKDKEGKSQGGLKTFDEVYVEFECESNKNFSNVTFALCFNDLYDRRITSLWNSFWGKSYNIKQGRFIARFHIPSLSLIPGEYQIGSYIETKGKLIESIDNLKRLSITYTDKLNNSIAPKAIQGSYVEKFYFEITYIP